MPPPARPCKLHAKSGPSLRTRGSWCRAHAFLAVVRGAEALDLLPCTRRGGMQVVGSDYFDAAQCPSSTTATQTTLHRDGAVRLRSSMVWPPSPAPFQQLSSRHALACSQPPRRAARPHGAGVPPTPAPPAGPGGGCCTARCAARAVAPARHWGHAARRTGVAVQEIPPPCQLQA